MSKVEMVFETVHGPWQDTQSVEVFVDGVLVGGGQFGGEPEDNIRCRDWAWVEKTMSRLATALGAVVVKTEIDKVDTND